MLVIPLQLVQDSNPPKHNMKLDLTGQLLVPCLDISTKSHVLPGAAGRFSDIHGSEWKRGPSIEH